MKKKAYCPACGNRELNKLFITTNRGKPLSLLLTSQSDLRKSSGDVCCIQCQHVWRISHLHK